MRSVDKGAPPTGDDGNALAFREYQEAAPYLMNQIGRFCSYCERTIPTSLAVEHKVPKTQRPDLALEWGNFLLACTNCNSTKGQKPVHPGDAVWPDDDDTFAMVAYRRSGKVEAVATLDEAQRRRVNFLLDLVGLRKEPHQLGGTDHRFFDRLELWEQVEASYQDLMSQPTDAMVRATLATAKATGGYSIWMTVFANHPAMRAGLVQCFLGTRA